MNKTTLKERKRLFYCRQQNGSTLIEVLVTLFIMAVGLLGLASMQVISLKNVNNSQFRVLATDYAYDMAERMRANSSGVDDGYYDDLDTDSASDPNCTACSTSEMAEFDAYEWASLIDQDVIDGGLPSGNGTVTENDGVYDINISWDEQDRDDDGGTVNSVEFTLSVQL